MKGTSRAIALVSGGSRGIGFAIANKLAEHGWCVGVTSRDAARAQTAASLLPVIDDQQNHFGFECNVTQSEHIENMFNQLVFELGAPNALINAAGIAKDSLLIRQSLPELHQMISTNLIGSILMCKNASKYMIKKKTGIHITKV